jgi:hypothetical protein
MSSKQRTTTGEAKVLLKYVNIWIIFKLKLCGREIAKEK